MLNATSRTFKGAAALTPNNVDRQAVIVSELSPNKGEEEVTLTGTTADATTIIGAYSANPGHEDNSVSIDVLGEFEIQMAAAVTKAHLGLGVVSSTTAGLGKALAGGFGKIIGGRTEGGKFYARVIN